MKRCLQPDGPCTGLPALLIGVQGHLLNLGHQEDVMPCSRVVLDPTVSRHLQQLSDSVKV